MKLIRLAIIRQKYRIDGGAEKFINRMYQCIDKSMFSFNIISRQWPVFNKKNFNVFICDPNFFGRVSREKGFYKIVQKLCKKKNLTLLKVMKEFQIFLFLEQEMEFIKYG